jgi:hypothetical protein
MIDALIPPSERAKGYRERRVRVYQKWHNARENDDADALYRKPEGWAKLKVDGKIGPETRRQLVLDYMNLDGTSLPEGTRVVTYGCGELYPLEKEEGEIKTEAQDGEHVRYNRRVEIFFFAKPFGILPEVPGVPKGQSTKAAVLADKGAGLYPEWRLRACRRYPIAGSERELCLVNEIGLPLTDRIVRVAVAGQEEVELVPDEDGIIRIAVSEGGEFILAIENVHEAGPGDSLASDSGRHFATGADGPEEES